MASFFQYSVVVKKYLSLAVIILAFEGIGAALGTMTAKQIPVWYNALFKPPLTPPDFLFGIVWPLLYLMMAVCAWRVWQEPTRKERTQTLSIFSLHMVLNWIWTPVFFIQHYLFAGLCVLAMVVITAIILFFFVRRLSVFYSYLLIPYIFWTLFATYLNFYIWWNN